MLDQLFKLTENNTDIKTEVAAGFTTFMAMSYIIFVQPAVLSKAGMDFGAVMIATCISSAFAAILMGFLTNYPIALAPAMGHNFYFAFNVCGAAAAGGLGYTWQTALGGVLVSGILFMILSFIGIRERIITIIPESLKYAIAVGIGFLIAMAGLQWAGIVVAREGTMIGLGDLISLPVVLSISGIILTAALLSLKIKGAILAGMLAVTILGSLSGVIKFYGIISAPPDITPTLFKFNIIKIAFGFVSYSIIKLGSGRGKSVISLCPFSSVKTIFS